MTDEKTRALIAEIDAVLARYDTERGAQPHITTTYRSIVDALRRAKSALSELTVPDGDAALERVRNLHRRSHAVFSWASGGLRYEDPCPECDGKAGVHPCGCWAGTDIEYVCAECDQDRRKESVPWPCPTIQALGPLPVGGEGDGE